MALRISVAAAFRSRPASRRDWIHPRAHAAHWPTPVGGSGLKKAAWGGGGRGVGRRARDGVVGRRAWDGGRGVGRRARGGRWGGERGAASAGRDSACCTAREARQPPGAIESLRSMWSTPGEHVVGAHLARAATRGDHPAYPHQHPQRQPRGVWRAAGSTCGSRLGGRSSVDRCHPTPLRLPPSWPVVGWIRTRASEPTWSRLLASRGAGAPPR